MKILTALIIEYNYPIYLILELNVIFIVKKFLIFRMHWFLDVLFINGLFISLFTRNIPFYPMVVSHSYTWESIVNTFIFIQLSIYLMHLLFLPILILLKKLRFSINNSCTWLRLTWIPWLHIYIQVLVLQLID